MAKIYIARHAESLANTQGIYQGQTYDTGLSKLGKKQAKALACRFKNQIIDRVVVSPLKRTMETAQGVAKLYGLKVVEERRIIETNHGKWEGNKKELIAKLWSETYKVWLTKPSKARFPGGETFLQTKTRVIRWWKEEAIAYGGTTLVVTHDNTARIIIAQVLGLGLDTIWRFQLHPAATTLIEIVDNKANLVCLNDMSHLANLQADIANHAI